MAEDQNTPFPVITEVFSTSADIARIAEKVEAVLVGESKTNAIITLMSMVVILQAPGIGEIELNSILWDLSKFMVLRLTGTDTPTKTEVSH